jgi:tetratricopeptide (TPR) repeat protein
LASVLVTARRRAAADEAAIPRLGVPVRVAVGVAAGAAIVAIAISLAATQLLRHSESEARAGNLGAALQSAQTAQNVQPGFAAPRLQQALVLEELGKLRPALEAVRGSTAREPNAWRTWLVRSRIEAELGQARTAVEDFRRARSLNPRSPLFVR